VRSFVRRSPAGNEWNHSAVHGPTMTGSRLIAAGCRPWIEARWPIEPRRVVGGGGHAGRSGPSRHVRREAGGHPAAIRGPPVRRVPARVVRDATITAPDLHLPTQVVGDGRELVWRCPVLPGLADGARAPDEP
jgi:hypothetical protein